MELIMYFIISLIITAAAYLAFPVIFSLIRNKLSRPYSRKTIWLIVIINGACVWTIFQIIRINAGETGTGAAVFLWSAVAYWVMTKIQPKEKEKKYTRLFTKEPEVILEDEPTMPIEENEPFAATQSTDESVLSAHVVKMVEDAEFFSMVEMLSEVDFDKREAVKSILQAFRKSDDPE